MKSEVFYTQESVERKINQLRKSGAYFTLDVEFDYDVELLCYNMSWEDYVDEDTPKKNHEEKYEDEDPCADCSDHACEYGSCSMSRG